MEVYLDNGATTKPRKEVVDMMYKALTEYYWNPSSLHCKGVEVERYVKNARKQLAMTLGANEQEIFFTSGGTEANNLAVMGAVEGSKRRGNAIITTKIEHPSVLNIFKNLEQKGYRVTYLKVNEYGTIDIEQFKQSLSDKTILVSIMHVNNEIGTIQPVHEIGTILKTIKNKPVFHVDAIQSFGKLQFSPSKIAADLVSVSGHKIHGPKGIGALYIRKGLKMVPLLYGGNQEMGIRSGTENVPGILGLGVAAEYIHKNLSEYVKRLWNIKAYFIEKVKNEIENIKINGIEGEGSAPHIVNISFMGLRGEVLLHSLEQEYIYVSTGSACSSKKTSASHVLKALGLKNSEIEGAIRFSFSYENTTEEIDYVVSKLVKHVKDLRTIIKR